MSDLRTQLEELGPRLTREVLQEMYRNPFWEERFGERGRKHARQDGDFHLSYLVQALNLRDAGVLARYAQWLQSVLTHRGMCSRHLAENFRLLADAIARERLSGGQQAVDYLRLAEASLDATTEAHEQFAAVRDRVAEAAVSRLEAEGEIPAGGERTTNRERCVADVLYHLSYLADSLAWKRPGLFVSYCQWVGPFLARRGVPVTQMTHLFRVIESVLSSEPELPDALKAEIALTMAAGRKGLESPEVPSG